MTAVEPIRIGLPKPHPGQQRVDAAFRDHRYVVVQCGRRWGKTKYGIRRACKAALAGQRVGWFAPTYKYALEAWREIVRRLRPACQTGGVSEQEKRVELPTGGVIEVWTLDTPDPARGRAYHLAIIDEAGIVRGFGAIWYEAIRPTLTDYRGQALFLGTPKGRTHDFSLLFQKAEAGAPGWAAIRAGTVENPYISHEEIEEARRDMPPGAFAQEYEGIPADDGGNPFGLDAIAACIGPASAGVAKAWGWDFARAQDWTVGVGLDDWYRVCGLERWQGKPWGETIGLVTKHTGPIPAWGDSTGVGDPVVEAIQKAGCPMMAVPFTPLRKQQLMERLATAIQRHEVTFPDNWLRAELDAFGYEYTRHGVRYTAPAGLHDDGVVALALAVHGRDQMGPLPLVQVPQTSEDAETARRWQKRFERIATHSGQPPQRSDPTRLTPVNV